MTIKVTILGAGPSGGVPSVGIGWGQCNTDNPKNRRLRPSILLDITGNDGQNTRVLVDTSPDLRQQLLAENVRHLDGVIYTHAHSDHVNGIDDLRGINRAMNSVIPVYSNRETLDNLKMRFGYAFEPLKSTATHYYKPTLNAVEIEPEKPFLINGVGFVCFEQSHGFSKTLGIRVGDFAYSTDVVDLNDETLDLLKGIKCWVIGVLTDQPHPTHAHVGKVLKWVDYVKPEQAILSHLGLGLDYDALSEQLPDNVLVGYDGMVIKTPT